MYFVKRRVFEYRDRKVYIDSGTVEKILWSYYMIQQENICFFLGFFMVM
jgi:hypothetical protein